FLKLFFFVVFAGAFAIRLRLCLSRGFLLVRDRAAPRTLSGASIGVGTLTPDRKPAPVPQAAVRAHLDVALDIHRDFFAQIALDRPLILQDLADAVDFVFGQVAHLLVKIDARAVQQRPRACTADSVDIGQPDLRPFFWRQIHSSDTCHKSLSLSLPLLVFRVYTDDPDDALTVDHLAFITDLFYRSPYFHDLSIPFNRPATRSWPRQHPWAVRSYGHAVLEMRRIGAVTRHRSPAVFPHLRIGLAGIDHRLDGQHHAFLQPWVLVLPVHIVWHLRLLVQPGADSVAYELANYRKPVGHHMPLDRSTHVEETVAGSHLANCQFERFTGHLHEPQHVLAHLADSDCQRRVAVISSSSTPV